MATTVNGTRPTQAPAPVPGPLSEQLDIATREVFDIMLQTPLRPVSAGEPPLVADLTVMVGLSGNVSGIVSMHCSAASAFATCGFLPMLMLHRPLTATLVAARRRAAGRSRS